MKKKTQEEFLEEIRKVHGDSLILDKCFYRGYLKNVTIGCAKHGYSDIRADHLLDGCGCHECAKESGWRKNSLDGEEFIKRCTEKHKNFYSYDKTHYVSLRKDITITCPLHGDFVQKASNHLNGCGCPRCGKIEMGNKKKLAFSAFKERANNVHNNKYQYIESSYKTANSKLKIICPEHGEFEQQDSVHLLGQGCPLCGIDTIREKRNMGLELFVSCANKIHNYRYGYNKSVYKNNYTKLIITCPKHGDFEQTPHNHLSGSGCPCCSTSHMERCVMEELDNLGVEYIFQASKKDIEWIGNQRLDFYLPNLNLAIECQGIQHFEPVDFAGKGYEWANNKLKYTIELDEKKKNKCEKNNVNIEYITYEDNLLKRIKEILKK